MERAQWHRRGQHSRGASFEEEGDFEVVGGDDQLVGGENGAARPPNTIHKRSKPGKKWRQASPSPVPPPHPVRGGKRRDSRGYGGRGPSLVDLHDDNEYYDQSSEDEAQGLKPVFASASPPESPGDAPMALGAGCKVVTLADGQRIEVVDEDEGATAAEEEGKQPGPPTRVFSYGEQCALEEDGEHEFKAVQNSKRPVDRIALYCEHYVNAFLNSDGGTCYFGIDDDGKVLGLPLNRKQRDRLRLRIDATVSAFKPQVDPYLLHVNFVKVEVPLTSVTTACPVMPKPGGNAMSVLPAIAAVPAGDNASTLSTLTPPLPPTPPSNHRVVVGLRFVVAVVVERGRAPVYFTPHGSAYIKRAGSVYKMDGSMVDERKRMGRPILPARRAREEPKRPHVLGALVTTVPRATAAASSTTPTPGELPPPTPASAAASAAAAAASGVASTISTATPAAVAERSGVIIIGGAGSSTSHPSVPDRSGAPGAAVVAPNDFVGREKELKKITDFVNANHPSPKQQQQQGKGKGATTTTTTNNNNIVVLLYGLPVVGKSALARRLMTVFSDRYPDFHFQINMKGVTSGYITITDAMVGVIRSVYPTIALPDNNLPAIKGIYESCFKGRQCMLLIENVGSVEHIAPLLPVTSKTCLAIATSRKDLSLDIALGSETTLSVKLGTMTVQDATALVNALLPHATPDEARELARLCGNMPLPIRLIGGVLRRKPNLTIPSMIKKLENSDIELMTLLESSLGVADEEYPPEVYNAMRSLCLFPATFDGCAATALLNKTYEEAEDILGVLLEYSLLDFDLTTGRYHMNDLVRNHALHKALASDPHVVDILRERFVRHFLGQLRTCRALLEELPRDSPASASSAKERATLLFTRERYNFEACSKLLQQQQQQQHSPTLGRHEGVDSGVALAVDFAGDYAAVCRALESTAAAPVAPSLPLAVSLSTTAAAGSEPGRAEEQDEQRLAKKPASGQSVGPVSAVPADAAKQNSE